MSLTASYIILVVLLARLILRKAPKIFSYALWAVVLFRLLCPVSVSSWFSILPAVQTQPAGEGQTTVHIHTGIAVMNSQVNEYLADHPYPAEFTPSEWEGSDIGAVYLDDVSRMVAAAAPDWAAAACRVWLAGAALLLGYSAASLLRLRRKLTGTLPLDGEKGVWLADHIPSPFVLGVLRPKIYLPSDLPETERDYILLHERTHIRRGDHILRALAWLALALHWFNPLVWLAFHLAGKDMEMSCDETVLRKMGRDVRADYSTSLLRLSAGTRLPAGPLAFGAGDPKNRIKNILNYKKPALWVIAAALVVVVCAGAALATNPGAVSGPGKPVDFVFQEPGPAECWLDYLNSPESLPWDDSIETQLPEFPEVTFRWTPSAVSAITDSGDPMLLSGELFGGMPVYNVYFCDLNGDGFREICATVCFGSGMIDTRVQVFDYKHLGFHELSDRGVRDYSLHMEDGRLWAVEREYPDGQVLRAGPLVMAESGLDIQNEFTGISLPSADLTFSLEESDSGPIVRMEGSVGGVALRRNAVWWAQGTEALFGGQPGGVGLSWQFAEGGAEVRAWWADDSHTAVTLSTQSSAMLSSLYNVGWWEFTVDLAAGAVTEMTAHPMRTEGMDSETHMYPASISDRGAVAAAQAAAKLLAAAEDYYNNAAGVRDAQDEPADQRPPYFRIPETDGSRVLIEGLGHDTYAEWNTSGSLYFEHDISYFLPARMRGRYELSGYASWADEARSVLFVSLERTDVDSLIQFTVDINGTAVTRTHTQAGNGGDLLELRDDELESIACAMSTLMIMAEDYYNNAAGVRDAQEVQAIQAVMDAIIAADEVSLTLAPGGSSRVYAYSIPSLGQWDSQGFWAHRLASFATDFRWEKLDAPQMYATTLSIQPKDSPNCIWLWNNSNLVAIRTPDNQIEYYQAVSNSYGEPVGTNIWNPSPYGYLRQWFDEAELSRLRTNSVPDRGQSHEDVVLEWIEGFEGAMTRCAPGSMYACTYTRAENVQADAHSFMSKEDMDDFAQSRGYSGDEYGKTWFTFSYELVFVPENENARDYLQAGNTADYADYYPADSAPEGAQFFMRVAYMTLIDGNWVCEGTGTGW